MRSTKIYSLLLIIVMNCGCEAKADKSANKNEPIFTIGTTYFTLENPLKKDGYYGGNRLINAQVWYPSVPSNPTDYKASKYYYRIDEVWDQLDDWTENDLNLVKNIPTKSLVGAPVLKIEESYPLIILSPSLGGNISMYTYYVEELVNKGYIVVGINHLYESEYAIDSKQKVIPHNPKFHDSLKTLKIPEEITADNYRLVKGVRQKVLGEDIVFLINELEANPSKSEIFNRIDFENIGAFGHSIGGAGITYATMMDDRIDAIVNIDGTPPSVALNEGIDIPSMFIEDLTDFENHDGYMKQYQRRKDFSEKNRNDAYRVMLAKADHNSFLDIHVHQVKNDKKKKEALKILQTSSKYMNMFFEKYLQNKPIEIGPIVSDSLRVEQYLKKQ